MTLTAYRLPATSDPDDTGNIFDDQFGLAAYITGRMGGWYEGVSDIGNGFAVTPGTGMQVRVDTGDALILGGPISSSAAILKTIDAAHASLNRIDTIVLQFNNAGLLTTGATIVVLKGANAASPVPAALTRSPSGIWQMRLAQVFVGAGVTSITAGFITDVRPQPRQPIPYKAGSSNFNTANVGTASPLTISGISGGIADPGWPQYLLQIAGTFDFTGATLTNGHVNCIAYVAGSARTSGKTDKLATMPAILHTEIIGPFSGAISDVHVEAQGVSFGSGEHANLNVGQFSNFTVTVIPA